MLEVRRMLRSCRPCVALIFATGCVSAPPLTPGIFLDKPRPEDTTTIVTRDITKDGLDLTKVSEGFRPHLYPDAANYCSIAYGHLVWRHPCDGTEPEDFRRGLSVLEGETLLTSDMGKARRALTQSLRNSGDLGDNQYSALCDFIYNVGGDNFRASTLRQVIEDGRFTEVPRQLRRWVWANGKRLDGLATRREREIALFFKDLPIPTARPGDTALKGIDITIGEQ